MEKMERKLKKTCCVILDPLNIESKLQAWDQHEEEQNKESSPKTKTYNINENVRCVTPCFVKLERNSLNTDKQTTTKSQDNYKMKTSVPFEPVTPKAPVEFSLELKKAINDRNILTSKTKKRVFDALDEIKNRTEQERHNYKREQVLLEIVNSETKYVRQIEIIINFFMKPTKERNLLKPEDYDILFRNINTIYSINRELLDEIDKGIENVVMAFSKIAPFLKLYSVYASEFKGSLKILQNARLLNPQFANFMENQETRPEVQNKLSALLITPIQRVPRYKLLLTNLYNLTKPSEPGFDSLSDCLEKIEAVAEHINKVVEDQENMQRLLEFQRCLRGEPNVITPGRKLIKEGILTKMSTKSGHSEKLYVVLMSDIVMFSKMKKDELKVNSLKCLSIFPLNKSRVIEILDKGCFKVICQEEELILYHDRFSETKGWIQAVNDAIEDHSNDRKTLRKESSTRRPVKRKDVREYHEVGLSPGKPLKKRRIDMDTRNENLTPTSKILKRKPIRSVRVETNENTSYSSLVFPDSTSLCNIKNSDANENGNKASQLSTDLYMFGNANENKGFKFCKFIGDVGSSIKKFLGFRN